MKLQFSGHESLVCKEHWLKKGHDFVQAGGSFSDESAVVGLGMGSKSVKALNFWMKAYGMMQDDSHEMLTPICRLILGTDGYDPYLENIGTIWLLHYFLIKTGKASVYKLFFNEYRKGNFIFSQDKLVDFLARKTQSEKRSKANHNTIHQDVSVFIRNYLNDFHNSKKVHVSDEMPNLMTDLYLMTSQKSENAEGRTVIWYYMPSTLQLNLPYQIVLYSIVDNPLYGESISFRDLMTAHNSPGAVFALSQEGLYKMIERMVDKYNGRLTYSDTAGVQTLQFRKGKFHPLDVLDDYYNPQTKRIGCAEVITGKVGQQLEMFSR